VQRCHWRTRRWPHNQQVLLVEAVQTLKEIEMNSKNVNPLQLLQLNEAVAVLGVLSSFGYLARTGMEDSERLAMAKMRGRNVLRSLGAFQPEPWRHGEVLGLDVDGKVMIWDDNMAEVSGGTQSIEEYGVHNFKEDEIARVGVRHEDWMLATRAASGASRKPHGWKRSIFVKAHITSNYGDGPSFAKIVVTEAFIERLERLTALCKSERLSEVRVTDGPDLWGGCDQESLRLRCPELVVSCGSFWFNDRPKHMDYDIQTRGKTTSEFIELAFGEGDGPIYIDGVEEDIALLDADDAL
jgi:hypothetical protein